MHTQYSLKGAAAQEVGRRLRVGKIRRFVFPRQLDIKRVTCFSDNWLTKTQIRDINIVRMIQNCVAMLVYVSETAIISWILNFVFVHEWVAKIGGPDEIIIYYVS